HTELLDVARADALRPVGFDAADEGANGVAEAAPASRETHAHRARIVGIGDTLDVSLLLGVIDERAHWLLGYAPGARELREARSLGGVPQWLSGRQMGRLDGLMPRLLEPDEPAVGEGLVREAQEGAEQGAAIYFRGGTRHGQSDVTNFS